MPAAPRLPRHSPARHRTGPDPARNLRSRACPTAAESPTECLARRLQRGLFSGGAGPVGPAEGRKGTRLPCATASCRSTWPSRPAAPVSGSGSTSTTWISVWASRRTLDTATCKPWYWGWEGRGLMRGSAFDPGGRAVETGRSCQQPGLSVWPRYLLQEEVQQPRSIQLQVKCGVVGQRHNSSCNGSTGQRRGPQ